MVTHVSVEYEVLFAVVVFDTLYRSCRLQLLVLFVIVPADYCDLIWDVHIGTILNRYCERMWRLQ